MANFEVLSLDPTTPQIRAPGAGDGYSVPRNMTFATGTTLNAPTTVVSVNTSTDALRITQVGSGNALLVEDSANPDATPTVITAAGDVGIGTASPGSLYSGANNLVVGGGSGSTGMTVYSGTTGTGRLFFADGTVGADAYRGWVEYGHTSNNLTFGTDGATRVTIDASGNVGIGTASPDRKLDVEILADYQIRATYNASNFADYGYFGIATSSGNPFYISPGGTERFRLTTAGDAVIGNGDTSATPANGVLRGTNGSGTNITGATLTIQGGRGTGSGEGGPIVFSTSAAGASGTTLRTATERMRITSAGDLLVGGTTDIDTSFIATVPHLSVESTSGGLITLFRNDTSVSTGNIFGGVLFYGNDTTSNTPICHAYVQALSAGTHAAGDNTTDLVFGTTPNNTETVAEAGRITQAGSYVLKGGTTTAAAGVGIIFPATQVASANANSLDDYEEGTWTATFTDSGIGTVGTKDGYYTKIGRVVTVSLYVEGSLPSVTPSGDLSITGLPFTSLNDAVLDPAYSGVFVARKIASGTTITVRLFANTATVELRNGSSETTVTTTSVLYANGGTSERVGFSLTYFTS